MSTRSKLGINKKRITAFLALLSFVSYMPVSCLPAFAVNIDAGTLPDLNNAINGSVDVNGNKMDVNVIGGKGTVGQFDWNSFNVGKDATVNWVFNANNQTALNRVLNSGGISYIYGKLTESAGTGCPSCVNTSKVILINPSGIVFGNGSQVDLNSFTASTYDIKGAKNIEDLLKDQEAYKQYAGTGGTSGTLFDIAGYNKTVSFVANDNMVDGNGYITGDATGTKLASIIADGASIKANKTVAMVGNKIDIQNSDIRTTYTSTPNTSNATQTRSNVKLVTGDGVNFYYTSAGNIDNNVTTTAAAAKVSGEEYGINIKDSEIRTGNFLAYNGVKDNGKIDIQNSTIYSRKLLGTDTTIGDKEYSATQTGTNGNIQITSKGTVNISDSNVQTTNEDSKAQSYDIGYGNLTIEGSEGVTIKNSQVRSADSTKNTDSNNIKAGNITIASSNGSVNLIQDKTTSGVPSVGGIYNTTGIVSAGNLEINAKDTVNVEGYDKIQAKGYGATTNTDRTITVNAGNASFKDTLLNAKNAIVNADNKIDMNKTTVVADNTKLYGANTTIDNSLLQYNDLAFYDANGSKTNNVTVKNNTTFNDKDSEVLKISTNGNLTLDNANLKKQSYNSTTTANQKAVNLESTKGNITIQNGSDVQTTNGSFTANAKNGAIQINDSNIYATTGDVELNAKNNIASTNSKVWAKDGNMTLTSTAGKVTANGSTIIAEGGNTVVDQALSMNIDEDFANSTVGATNKLSLISDADITGTTLTAGGAKINDYTDLVSLNNDDINTHFIFAGALVEAGNDISITDLASANKVDFVAGNNIDLASTVDMTLTDVSTKAGNNTNIAAAGKLTTADYEILGGKKTTLSGKTVTTAKDTVIKTNQNKLAVNAEGAVDIAVTGVTNAKNGIEINADVNTSQGSDPLEGKTVKVNAKDGTLAISKIKADTLDLTANKILKADTTISKDTDNVGAMVEAGADIDNKGYIEVRTDGGFNLDATKDYNDGNKDIYTGGNYGTTIDESTVAVGDEYDKVTDVDKNTTIEEELIKSETIKGDEIGRTETERTPVGDPVITTEREDNVKGPNGEDGYTITTTTEQEYEVTTEVTYDATKEDTYKQTEVTETTTETTTYQDYETTTKTRDEQHIATLNKEEQNGFVLVYGKGSTDKTTETKVVDVNTSTSTTRTELDNKVVTTPTTITETITSKDVDVKKDVVFCEYEDVVAPDADFDSWTRIPRHSEGISNQAPVQNDLADTTATVVAAAARLQIDDEGNEEDDSDDGLLE